MSAPLPLRREEWPPELREDHQERASIVWADRGADPSPQAWRDAERTAALLVRSRVARTGR